MWAAVDRVGQTCTVEWSETKSTKRRVERRRRRVKTLMAEKGVGKAARELLSTGVHEVNASTGQAPNPAPVQPLDNDDFDFPRDIKGFSDASGAE